jgi:FAD:protein FMN transferase
MLRATSTRAVWLTAAAVVAAAPLPASAEVYLNESQALAAIFGEKALVQRELKTLDDATRTKLERASGLRFPEPSYVFFIATQSGKPQKYAVQLDEIGKSEPITFMVGMSPEGKVTDVVIMVFRESRGWEVKEKRFLNQFRGKTLRNSIRVDEDIINYTGATLSSKAVARGVKRALLLLDTFYLGEVRYKLAPAKQFAQPLPLPTLSTAADFQGSLGLYRQSRYAMGSICEIRLWCRSALEARQAFTTGFAEINRIEQVFSAYREDSELSLVNREAGRGPVHVSEEFFSLVQYAIRSWHRSLGAVDATVGPLMKAWGFWQGEPRMPSHQEILQARHLVGCDKVHLDRRTRTVQFQRHGMELDLGGLAKGHAAKRTARALQKQGVAAALVNLGGSSLCASDVALSGADCEVDQETGLVTGEWPIGVIHPGDSRQCPLHFLLKPGWALSTSGTYERQWEVGGTCLSHILDPRTGDPLRGLRSVTAITRSGRRSEALAKHLLVLSSLERSAWPQQANNCDWVYLEASPTGALAIQTNFPRIHLLASSNQQS